MPVRLRWKQGALWGLVIGIIVAVYSQVIPRVVGHPGRFFTGAPQGLDEWTYFSMIRAIWRTGNGFTYRYPYAWGEQFLLCCFIFILQ